MRMIFDHLLAVERGGIARSYCSRNVKLRQSMSLEFFFDSFQGDFEISMDVVTQCFKGRNINEISINNKIKFELN